MRIAVIGLGYVGMPLAIAFAEKVEVIGFDINSAKIEKYKQGIDVTNEVGDEALRRTRCQFTSDENSLDNADFFIVAVPTPIAVDKTPDLAPVVKASEIVGRHMKCGAYVVYESTVYPGVTEDVCMPILEKVSGMKCGKDFKVGYSPERINPSDKIHTLRTIKKIVSGMDGESLEKIAGVYEMIIEAGVYRAGSIKVAEAAKVVENSQRDINIAFMNELAMVFDKMGIDTKEVIDAMNTKWNALGFTPGLVGGHCIGVDPYYFIYKAEQLGYHSQIIMSGRKINDDMGKFVGDVVIKKLIEADKKVKNARVAIMGITFKENCPDVRNSKVVDIIERLREYGIEVFVTDPAADREEALHEYGIEVRDINGLRDMDAIVIAVAHSEYRQMSIECFDRFFRDDTKVLVDVKSIIDKKEAEKKGYVYWRL